MEHGINVVESSCVVKFQGVSTPCSQGQGPDSPGGTGLSPESRTRAAEELRASPPTRDGKSCSGTDPRFSCKVSLCSKL